MPVAETFSLCVQRAFRPLKMWRKFPNLRSVSKWQVGKLAPLYRSATPLGAQARGLCSFARKINGGSNE
jgi:hypothetical protein